MDLSNQRDIQAAERYIQFYLGWFATPLFQGDYPQVMKEYIGRWAQRPPPRSPTPFCGCQLRRCFPPGRKSGQQGLGTSRLPVFSPQEKSYIKGTCDFLGLGHFTTRYISQRNYPSGLGDSYFADRDLAELVDPQWPDPGSEWLYSVPWGFRRLLNFVKVKRICTTALRQGAVRTRSCPSVMPWKDGNVARHNSTNWLLSCLNGRLSTGTR